MEQTKQKVQSDESVRIEFTLSKEAFEKLKLAQELLSHAVPTQDLATFLEHICDKVIKQKTSVSATDTAANVALRLPLTRKKKVLSTQVCCQYKSPVTGRTCGNKWFAQVDHKQPKWADGDNDVSNLQRLCAQHNQLKYRREAGIVYKS